MSAPAVNRPILLGANNPAKQSALRQLLEGLPLRPVTPTELGLTADPAEDGDSHQSIAAAKAVEWSRLAAMLVIASDGGLLVPALGHHWESRYTHRFAGPAADDAERRRRLLQLLSPHTGPDREASWVEALAVADRGRLLKSWQITGSRGSIAEKPADGPHAPGFWVFPLWYFPALGKYYNALTPEERAALGDHWAALGRLVRRYFLTAFPAG